MNIYKLTLLALLAALGVAGRSFLGFIPNVQPVTSLIIICGFLLGPMSAVMLSVLITLASNLLLGSGIWTIWQIISWSLIGLASGLLGKYIYRMRLYMIAIFSVFCGYFYGFLISLTMYRISGDFFLAYYFSGLPFDTYHALGNAIFIFLLFPILSKFIRKYAANRFDIQHIKVK
ncbi:ECF transporter S component [Virgibacillus halophilus]|uniref:ECF transporter S component n=1 Tax=Tigheibacillus halophilus TaxID=361280 RepID=UPI00363A0DD7